MLNFKIDIESLEKQIKKLSSWDDWEGVEKDIFRTDEWPEINSDISEKEMERSAENIDGCEWKPVASSYDISPEILYLHEKSRWKVFAKLEPDADEENRNHPEWYGKWCPYCKIWAREYSKDCCSKCGNELLSEPIND